MQDSERLTGWAAFAGTVLIVVGFLNGLYGLAALLNDNVITSAGGGTGVIIWDFTTWGWVHLAIGAILVLTAFGVFAGQNWARVVAIIIAVIGAITQVGMITVFPLWSILMVILYVLVIYNLTVKGLTTDEI